MEHNPEGKVRFYLEIKVSQVQGTIKWSHLSGKCCDLDHSFNLLSGIYYRCQCGNTEKDQHWLDPMIIISQIVTGCV